VLLDQPLQVVTPTVDGAVLAALAQVDAAFTGRGVHRLLGRYSAEGVRRALDRLVIQGIVDVSVAGPSKLYRLNREHLAAPHVIALSRMKDEFIDRLRERIAGWLVPAAYAALFGSAVTVQMRPDSDIDVLVIRPDRVAPDYGTWISQVQQLGHDGSRWTGNDLRVLEMSQADATLADMTTQQLLRDVSDQGIRLAGPDAYLRGMRARTAARHDD
jgi:Nucleotidyltransferase domain